MKKIFNKISCRILLTIFLSGLYTNYLQAQIQYDVIVAQGRYTEIGSGTTLTYIASQDGYFKDFPFKFTVFQRIADFNMKTNPPSQGAWISKTGLAAVYESPGYQNTIVFQPFESSSFKVNPDSTKVSTRLEGTMPNRVLKIQWKNLLKDSNLAEKINMQVWLHEKDSSVSYHYGPNTLNSRAMLGLCGIVVLNSSFTATLNQVHAEGSPSKPTIYRNITDFSWPTLDSFPAEGMVITFKRQKPSSVNVPQTVKTNLQVYPNPCTTQLNISQSLRSGTLLLYDMLGNTVMQNAIISNDIQLDVNTLQPGIYTLVLKGENSMEVRKIIKQ